MIYVNPFKVGDEIDVGFEPKGPKVGVVVKVTPKKVFYKREGDNPKVVNYGWAEDIHGWEKDVQ